MYSIVERLRGLDAEQLTVDEMIELRAGATMLQTQYALSAYEVPEWLTERAALLDRELSARRSDAIRKRLKEIEAQELNLEDRDEKRSRLRQEKERLQGALGQPAGVAGSTV